MIIKNFEIDHTKLGLGVYKHSTSGLVTTWSVRIKKPNSGEYLTPEIMHSIEHTLVNYLRFRFSKYRIVGAFPMGSQTGFYVLTRFIDRGMISEIISDYALYLQSLSLVPGANIAQCGQYKLHDLYGASREMLNYYEKCSKYEYAARKY